MFRFRKVRGPEQKDETINSLEKSANRLDDIVQTAQKEKSRLNLLVGDVSQRMAQINQTAASFEQTTQKISDFKVILENIENKIRSVQAEAKNLQNLKRQTAELFSQFSQLKSQLKEAEDWRKSIQEPLDEFNILLEKTDKTKAEIIPELSALGDKQVELLDKFKDFVERLEKAEGQLGQLADLRAEFEKTTEKVTTESARITTWMGATEKMSERLTYATELFEVTKQKIDRLHELTEYVESKTKSLSKQKELLKNAHIEAGKSNAIFWEIKSKFSELEQDTEKIRKMERRTSKFEFALKSIESRFDRMKVFSDKLDQLLSGYSRLESQTEQMKQHQKMFDFISELTQQLQKRSQSAGDELVKLENAGRQINILIKRSEDSHNESRSLLRQLTELQQNAEKFLNRAPDVNRVSEQVESIRKKVLTLENKLLETMAMASDMKGQSDKAAEVKQAVAQFRRDTGKRLSTQKKELETISEVVANLRNDLKIINSRSVQMLEIQGKLAEAEKQLKNLDKTYRSIAQREQTVFGLKSLMEQNMEAFKKFEHSIGNIHQKILEIINIKSNLEKIECRVSALDSNVKRLPLLGEKIEKTDKEVNSLADELASLNCQIEDSRKLAGSVAEECANIRKSQENLRLDAGEVMDLFGKLTDLRLLVEEKTKVLNEYFEQVEQKFLELNNIRDKAAIHIDEYGGKLNGINDAIESLNRGEEKLNNKFIILDNESEKIISLANSVKEKQMEIASLSEKVALLESRLATAENLQKRIEEFERSSKRTDSDMKKVVETLDQMGSAKDELYNYDKLIAGLERKIEAISSKVKGLDKFQKDLNKASIMAEELKARQKSLADDEVLINRAITAASRLGELVHSAEHITKESK